MAATFLGTDAVLGMSAQTGMIIQSQESVYSTERKFVLSEAGEKVGIALWGDELNTSVEALVPTSSVFATRMAVKLVLANAPGDFFRSAASAGYGDSVLVGVTQRAQNSDFHTFNLSFLASPFMDADA